MAESIKFLGGAFGLFLLMLTFSGILLPEKVRGMRTTPFLITVFSLLVLDLTALVAVEFVEKGWRGDLAEAGGILLLISILFVIVVYQTR